MHQTGPTGKENSTLQYVTLTVDVYQVCHCVGRCVKIGVVLRQACSESQWTVLLGYLALYLNKC